MTLPTQKTQPTILRDFSAASVIGLGVTGYSVVRYLRARSLQVTVYDSGKTPPRLAQLRQNYPEVNVHLGDFSQYALNPEHLIVTSPGVALREPLLRKVKDGGAKIVGDVELFLGENNLPVIAITGSNGKSTVTSLVGEMCVSSGKQPLVAGNIGLPVLDALTDGVHYDIVVLELSSFQLETITQVPAEAAAILNISADHMDRYDSMGDYVLAKARILRGAKRVVLPRHDEQLKQITNVSENLSFDLGEPSNDFEFGVARLSNYRWLVKGRERLIKLREIPLVGLHNIKNVLAAFALTDFLDLPRTDQVEAIKGFVGLPHRMQTILKKSGVTWVNDSKATNIGATSTALRNIEQNVVWIAGGQSKGADFRDLRDAIGGHIKLLVLFGEDASEFERALTSLLPIKRAANMQEAVETAHQAARKNSIILLSPACASFDMYDNFEHRGNDFAQCAETLVALGAA